MFSKIFSVCALVLVLGVSIRPSHAVANNNDFIDSAVLDKVSHLINTVSEASPNFYGAIYHALEKVGKDPVYKQVAQALILRAESEIIHGSSPEVLTVLIGFLGDYLPEPYAAEIDRLHKKYFEINRSAAHPGVLRELHGASVKARANFARIISDSRALAQYNAEKLEALEKEESVRRNTKVPVESIAATLRRFRTSLEKEIKGQPEVIDMLVDIRRKDLILGRDTDTEVLWLMGLPGTGKDTAAKAYVNAIWGSPTAWQEHMFHIGAISDEFAYTRLVGSGPGYVNSDSIPPLIQFLVNHSCGRYKLEQAGRDAFRVVENSNWRQEDTLNCPQNAVVYFDEFHDWAYKYKNLFAKKALDGNSYFIIANPNGGLDKIYVPVTIIIGSNDGIELISSREKNGQRFGPPMSYEQMMERYQRIGNNVQTLKNAILSNNGEANNRVSGDAPGNSKEILDRVERIVLMRPLAPEHLREIVDMQIGQFLAKLQKGIFKDVKFTWSSNLLALIQEYDYEAENNARPMREKVDRLIQKPLLELIEEGEISPVASNIEVDIQKNNDGTYQLVAKVDRREVSRLIKATEVKRARQPISDERLQELAQLGAKLNERVIGQKGTLEEVARAIFLSEEGRQGITTISDAKEPARVFMFLGWTSTGKTETSKALAEVLLGSRDAAHVFAFTPATNEHDIRAKILGITDSRGNCIPSEFMKVYDRNSGRAIIVFDEIANVRDKGLLNMLYDTLREPVVTTFCDGQPRIMSNITILITGNAGQEVLQELPANLPSVIRRAGMKEAHNMLMKDINLRRAVYEKYFSPAFLARVGDNRIFNYAPLDYLAAAELFQLKIKGALKDLKPKEGRRGWEISFASEAMYRQIIDAFEREGFEVREQGASIDRFVNETFKGALRELLLKELVPNGSKVTIEFVGIEKEESFDPHASKANKVVLAVNSVKGRHVIKLNGQQVTHPVHGTKEEVISTAFHEAGHALVTKTYFEGYFEPEYIKILPGVAHIVDRWVYYAGLASSQDKIKPQFSLEYVLREIAILMGGAVAEDLIMKGGISTAGKSNDIMRATQLAEKAILQLGLVEKWGSRVGDKSQLSEADRQLLAQLTNDLLKDGTELARRAIMANTETFLELGNTLARKGLVNAEGLRDIWQKTRVKTEDREDIVAAAEANKHLYPSETVDPKTRGLKTEFNDKLHILPISEVVDLEAELEKERTREISKLVIDKEIPIGGRVSKLPVSKNPNAQNCADILSPRT